MKWVTRERPRIDRLACPWLIQKFIDAEAEIIYVPADQVVVKADQMKAIPFDVRGSAGTDTIFSVMSAGGSPRHRGDVGGCW